MCTDPVISSPVGGKERPGTARKATRWVSSRRLALVESEKKRKGVEKRTVVCFVKNIVGLYARNGKLNLR